MQKSYCTGVSGIALSKNVPELGKIIPVVEKDVPESNFQLKEVGEIEIQNTDPRSTSSTSSSESESKSKRKKSKKKKKKKKEEKKAKKEEVKDALKKALDKEDERLKEVDRIMKIDERKRPYNSMYEVSKPTDEEIEAYNMKKHRGDDPMANFI